MQFNEDSVLTLGANNFQALENYPRVLVKFHAPWCGHCQAIAPEFAAAADSLAEQGVEAKLAQVDAVEHENLAAEHGVEGYPTFLWFDAANKDEDGDVEPHEYRGGRERADFAAFVMRRSGEPSDEIVDALAAAQWAVSFASAHEDRIGGSRSRAVSGRNLASISAGIGILTYLPVASLVPAYEQAIQAYVEVATFAHTTDATVYAAAVKAASDLVPDSSAASASADGKQPAALLLKPFDERAAALPPTDADGAKLRGPRLVCARAHSSAHRALHGALRRDASGGQQLRNQEAAHRVRNAGCSLFTPGCAEGRRDGLPRASDGRLCRCEQRRVGRVARVLQY